MTYEELKKLAKQKNINVIEDYDFKSDVNGLLVNNSIALSNKLSSDIDKKCVLAEEIAHYMVNYGNITDLRDLNNSYQEQKAHSYAIELVLSLTELIDTIIDLKEEANIETVADKLEISKSFLIESLELYSRRFNGIMEYNNYYVCFNPVHVYEKNNYLNGGDNF